jgi:hypothetical protein
MTILFVFIHTLLDKYSYNNIQLHMWILLFTLYILWFQEDTTDGNYLDLNVKLVGCTFRFCVDILRYLNSPIMIIALMIGNFFIILAPSSLYIPISVQVAFMLIFIQFLDNNLYFFLHGQTLVPHFAKEDGSLIAYVVSNNFYVYCLLLLFLHFLEIFVYPSPSVYIYSNFVKKI